MIPGVVDQRVLVHRRAGSQHDEGSDRLAGVRVGHADYAHFDDVRVASKDVLDLRGEHVEPGHDDQVLGPIDEVQAAVVVAHGDVAGAQPAVRRQHPRRRFRIVEVPGEHVRSFDPDLTGVADERVAAVLVDEADLDTVEHPPDGPEHGGSPADDVTIGDASVSPYPSAMATPNRSRTRSATDTGSLAAPDSASRTVASESLGASSKWAKATHTAGEPGTTVTPRERIDSSAVAGSKRCTRTSVAPTDMVNPKDHVEPEDVVERDDAVDDVLRTDAVRASNAPARCSTAGCRA